MKKGSFWGLMLAVILVSAGIIFYFTFDQKVSAAGAGDVDGVVLHIETYLSADNGVTWSNFNGTEGAGNQTVSPSPNSQLLFRVKVWNTGNVTADNVQITGNVTNSSYVSGLVVTNSDLDADGNTFNGFTFTNGGTGQVAGVLHDTTATVGYQGIQGTIQLSNSFPVGQTILDGTVTIGNYTPLMLGKAPLQFIHRAFAVGVGNFSTIRIIVAVAAPAATPVATPVATLPATGASQTNFSFLKYFSARLRTQW